MARKRKKSLSPDELKRVQALLEDLRRDVDGLIRFVQAKLGEKPA